MEKFPVAQKIEFQPFRWYRSALLRNASSGFLILICCSGCRSIDLEYQDVMYFKAVPRRSDPAVLVVSGESSHSSLGVEKTYVVQTGDTATVRVKLVELRTGLPDGSPGTGGHFDYVYEIPAEVNSIYFGEKRKLVWERNRAK
jgi:hypothetical protein